jgi:DNA-directed RNA polymerase specialized sigma24 family protein
MHAAGVSLGQGRTSDDNRVSDGRLDTDEVRRLYDQHGRPLLAYGCSLLRDPSAAEDVLHHVFVRLLRGGVEIAGPPVRISFARFGTRRSKAKLKEILKPLKSASQN